MIGLQDHPETFFVTEGQVKSIKMKLVCQLILSESGLLKDEIK